MPSKKKKYNARFPAGRIKKIMQSDEEVGKVAQAVPIIISRTLELFVDSLLTKTLKITNSRNAKTLSTSHMKQCIMSEQRFDFLRELVRNIPDISVAEEAANYQEEDNQSSPEEQYPDSDTPYDLSMPSTSLRAGRQQQQQPISNGHNGGGHHATQVNAAHQPNEYQRNYLKRSMSSNPSSVIRHTTAMAQTNVDCLPAKLARSDSTPVPQQQQQQLSTAASLTTVQHPRLKHQSYSMPTHMENSNNNNNNNINNKPNTQTPLKTLCTPSQQTAIPAPIVNIDYCSKPVVKIDYSNLPLVGVTTPANTVAAPLSAPANISSTAFNFSAEPVINIDLSNIVASPTSAIPSMATISIGTPTLPPPPKLPVPTSASTCTAPSTLTTSSSSSLSSLLNKTKPLTAKTAVVEQQSRNSKAAMAEPFNSSTSSSTTNTTKATALAAAVAAATTMTTTISATKSDSYLDMDEDYDNI
ncbi:dr1-associated corepressor homolog [Lucilia cuprina]|uniref:dr1-associated corepressor homolog n=1 Tax=Lucilia cuprina TaxID=7375 RepID=UPI001F06B162|nr:dr1-associated corepressor homolog [Lucilia cuprina]XP_046809702.1 dr1-associated corepressor homolog [Lucilia cuprina]